MPNKKNIDTVKNLREKISGSNSILLAEYKGLSVNEVNELRAKVLETNADITVSKNTLLKIALEEEGMKTDVIEEALKGQTMTIFSYEDPITPIKAVSEFAKSIELPRFKAAFIEGIYTTADQLEILSKLPGKDQLLAQVVGGLKSPINGIVNVLSGTQKKLVIAFSEIAKNK